MTDVAGTTMGSAAEMAAAGINEFMGNALSRSRRFNPVPAVPLALAAAGHLKTTRICVILLTSYNLQDIMTANRKLTTIVSTKGQVILPKAIREQRHWPPGTALIVEDTPDGVLLKAAPFFAPTRPKDVFGSLPHKGRPKTFEEMEAGIAAELRRRHARNRY